MAGENAAHISSLFMELASETRFSILLSLDKKPARLSTLSRALSTSAQDVFRNLNRLVSEGLVRKEDGEFFITENGSMVVHQVPYFSFLKKHKKFFESHTLISSGIPLSFLLRIGELVECTKVSVVTAVFQKLKRLESSSNSSLRVMVPQAWPEEGEILVDRASHGVKVQSIVGHNTIIPRDVIDGVGGTLDKLAKGGLFDTRMVEKVGVGIYLSDNSQAGLMFPRAEGEVDMTTMFYSEDQKFCGWCSDLFSYFWQGAKKFDVQKAKVID